MGGILPRASPVQVQVGGRPRARRRQRAFDVRMGVCDLCGGGWGDGDADWGFDVAGAGDGEKRRGSRRDSGSEGVPVNRRTTRLWVWGGRCRWW